jgi:hypothetical protein
MNEQDFSSNADLLADLLAQQSQIVWKPSQV